LYSVFEKEGLNNKKIGLKYRKEILEKGSSRDEMASVEAFLGRKVNSKALVESLMN
jgi:Zn-dependent oligopeptidase